MMQTIQVQSNQFSYPIFIGRHLLASAGLLKNHVGSQVLIVTNDTLKNLYVDGIKKHLAGMQCDVVVLPDGESYKNLTTLAKIFDALLLNNHHKNTTLLALGGGVIGDMTGFAAACYMRGVNYIQLPTTLLAQIDAAIGGKTAVNHPLGKNMLGFFYQPKAVIADISMLASLPDREYRSGIAEMIKYALISDRDFFIWLEKNMPAVVQKNPQALEYAIVKCCQIKATIVGMDPNEQGSRTFLNLGHTFGHAFEAALGYGKLLHGEAVGIGLLCAIELSLSMKFLTEDILDRVRNLLVLSQLPILIPKEVSIAEILAFMMRDKKIIHNDLRFVLLKSIGEPFIAEKIPLERVEECLKKFLGK